MRLTVCEVVSRGSGYRNDFPESIASGLPCFGLNNVKNRVASIENQIVEFSNDRRSLRPVEARPVFLRPSRRGHGRFNISRTCGPNRPNVFTSRRIAYLDEAHELSILSPLPEMASCYNAGRHG